MIHAYHGIGKTKIGDDVMYYTIPAHIKLHVNRLVREYEILYHGGHKIALQVFEDSKLLSGIETTELYLNRVRNFRKLLDTQDDKSIFSGTEDEVRRKIYLKINEFYAPLSEKAIRRVINTTDTQEQLDRALRRAKKNPAISADAKNLSWFISNACTHNWCELDATVKHKVFKLVQSEEAFEKLLARQNTPPIVEITQKGVIPYTTFRIAFQFIDIHERYKKQSKVREFNNFWESHSNVDTFDIDCQVFHMWNNISDTGVYYAYIPKV